MKTAILILTVLAAVVGSCKNKTAKTAETETGKVVTEQNNIQQQTDTVLTEDEIIGYLETFKELLLNNKIEGLADLIHFPVEGDYMWEDDNGEVHFNYYHTKADFIGNYSKLFGKDLVSLLENVDCPQVLQEDYSVTIKRELNIELTFNVVFRNMEQELHFNVNYDEPDCDVCESSIIYRLKKNDGTIKLTSIQMAG